MDKKKKALALLLLVSIASLFVGLLVGNVQSTLSFNKMLEEENLYLVDKAVVNSCVNNLNIDNLLPTFENKNFRNGDQNTTISTIK